MVETIVPVVHGTRSWIVSLLAFAAGALLAAAALGLALGAVLPTSGPAALLAGGAFALAYALSEAGWLRLPSPQLRRQVPQGWRERYPLPVTSLLYGAGLGVGFVTYVPVATLLVVCACVALASGPAAGAAVLSGFAAGRAGVLVVSTLGVRSYECATGRVERMAAWAAGARLRRANALALAVLSAVLLLAATTGTAHAATRIQLGSSTVADPSQGPGDMLAYDQVVNGVVQGMLWQNGAAAQLPGTHPDIDGTRVIVDTGPDFEIVDTATGHVNRTLHLTGTDPALSGNWVVFRRRTATQRLILAYNLSTAAQRTIAAAAPTVDLGEPDISGPRVVYTSTSSRLSTVRIYRLDLSSSRVVRQATRDAIAHAAIDGTVVGFTRQSTLAKTLVRVNLVNNTAATLFSEPRGTGRWLWEISVHAWQFRFTLFSDTTSYIYRP